MAVSFQRRNSRNSSQKNILLSLAILIAFVFLGSSQSSTKNQCGTGEFVKFFSDGNQECASCDGTCQTCEGNSFNCTSCDTNGTHGVLQMSFSCSDACPAGQFVHQQNESAQKCSYCESPCQECTGDSQNCLSCGSDSFECSDPRCFFDQVSTLRDFEQALLCLDGCPLGFKEADRICSKITSFSSLIELLYSEQVYSFFKSTQSASFELLNVLEMALDALVKEQIDENIDKLQKALHFILLRSFITTDVLEKALGILDGIYSLVPSYPMFFEVSIVLKRVKQLFLEELIDENQLSFSGNAFQLVLKRVSSENEANILLQTGSADVRLFSGFSKQVKTLLSFKGVANSLAVSLIQWSSEISNLLQESEQEIHSDFEDNDPSMLTFSDGHFYMAQDPFSALIEVDLLGEKGALIPARNLSPGVNITLKFSEEDQISSQASEGNRISGLFFNRSSREWENGGVTSCRVDSAWTQCSFTTERISTSFQLFLLSNEGEVPLKVSLGYMLSHPGNLAPSVTDLYTSLAFLIVALAAVGFFLFTILVSAIEDKRYLGVEIERAWFYFKENREEEKKSKGKLIANFFKGVFLAHPLFSCFCLKSELLSRPIKLLFFSCRVFGIFAFGAAIYARNLEENDQAFFTWKKLGFAFGNWLILVFVNWFLRIVLSKEEEAGNEKIEASKNAREEKSKEEQKENFTINEEDQEDEESPKGSSGKRGSQAKRKTSRNSGSTEQKKKNNRSKSIVGDSWSNHPQNTPLPLPSEFFSNSMGRKLPKAPSDSEHQTLRKTGQKRPFEAQETQNNHFNDNKKRASTKIPADVEANLKGNDNEEIQSQNARTISKFRWGLGLKNQVVSSITRSLILTKNGTIILAKACSHFWGILISLSYLLISFYICVLALSYSTNSQREEFVRYFCLALLLDCSLFHLMRLITNALLIFVIGKIPNEKITLKKRLAFAILDQNAVGVLLK